MSNSTDRIFHLHLIMSRRRAIIQQLSHLQSMGAFDTNKNIFTKEWVQHISVLSGVSCYENITTVLVKYAATYLNRTVPESSWAEKISASCQCSKCCVAAPNVIRDQLLIRRIKSRKSVVRGPPKLHQMALMKCHKQYVLERYSNKMYSLLDRLASVVVNEL